MSVSRANNVTKVIYPYKCSGSHDPAYPPAECRECRDWVEKYYPRFTVEEMSIPIDPPLPMKHGGLLTSRRWHVLKDASGRVISEETHAEGVIASVAYKLHRWGTSDDHKSVGGTSAAEEDGKMPERPDWGNDACPPLRSEWETYADACEALIRTLTAERDAGVEKIRTEVYPLLIDVRETCFDDSDWAKRTDAILAIIPQPEEVKHGE